MDYTNDVEQFVNENKGLKKLYAKLTLDNGKIETKVLYNQLIKLKQDLHETLHTINYGINYSDKNDSKQQLHINALPFSESGAIELTDQQFKNTHINTIYFSKVNLKSIKALKNGKYNNKAIDGSIKVISEGENTYNRKKFKKSYYIQYQYITTTTQEKSFKRLMKNLKKSCRNNRNYLKYNDFKDFIRCTYNFPYFNQTKHYNAFKQYFKEITQLNNRINFSDIYPRIVRDIRTKRKFFNSTSWNNNRYKDYSLRTRINRNLANIIYNIDLNRHITYFYNSKNQLNYTKRKQRLFLKDLLVEISKHYPKRFNSFIQSLIKDFNNRIYLFETYGIKALVNQITRLKQFYNTKFLSKRVKEARITKKAFITLEQLIPKRKQYLEMLKLQRTEIIYNLIKLNPSSVLIQSILHDNIEKYLQKSIIRKVDTPRSPKELVSMACNNVKTVYIEYMNSMPVYVKHDNIELNKFDEILDNDKNTKIEYIDKESKINVISLFKAITQFDRFFDLSDLYYVILNSNINEKQKLKEFIYQEKHILNA